MRHTESRIRTSLVAAIASFALLWATAAASAQNILKTGWEGIADEIRPAIATMMAQTKTTGMSLVLVDGDEVVWSEGFGLADAEAEKKVDADTMFEIGSVSKTFTGLMVMQLAEQGKLDIDRPVTDYIPGFALGPTARDFPRNDRPITVRDMMAHHSGIPGDFVAGAFAVKPDLDFNKRLLAWLAEDYATYPPGYRWAYSNTAVALLENVIEAASGREFPEYSEAFLASMGMAPASFYKRDPELLSHLSKAYADGNEFPQNYINIPASGSIVASANQMGRYLRTLLGEGSIGGARILKSESLNAMLAPQYPGNPPDSDFTQGLSFILFDPALSWAGPVYWHNGATLAYRSHLEVIPGRKLAAFAVANSTGSGGIVASIAKSALVAALKARHGIERPEEPKSAAPTQADVPERMLANLAGVYVNDDAGAYEIFTPTAGGLAWRTGPAGPDGAMKDHGLLRVWSDGLFRTAADSPVAYEFKEARGRQIMVLHAQGASITQAERFAPKPIPAAWKARLGSWIEIEPDRNDLEHTMGDLSWFSLKESDGMLILNNGITSFVLDPVSDGVSAICGLGRYGGLTVRAVRGADGRESLKFMMRSYGVKGADPAAFGAAPPALPGLVPAASYGGGRAWRSSVGGYPVLSLQGSWREMGRQYGALLSKELREFHAGIAADLAKRGLTPAHAEQMRQIFTTYTPEMRSLLEGMAETSGLSFGDHLLLDASFYLLPGLVIEAADNAPACSGIAVSAPRTVDGKLYFARNWDMTREAMLPYMKYIALVAFNPTDGSLSFANIRPIGQTYVETGFNEKGVLVELNNGSGSDAGCNPDARFSVASLFDFIRTADSLDAMIEKLTTAKLDASYIIQAASPERAVSVEIPTFGSRVVEETGGVLYALNHFKRPTWEPWLGKVIELPQNAHDDRQVCLDALLDSPEWRAGVTLDTVKRMMDATVDKGGPVVDGTTFGTVLQVIAVPVDMRIMFRGFGHSGWADLDLSALFD